MASPAQNIAAASFAAKFASKKELFNFLSVEVGAYLCDHEVLTVYFLKDLVAGKKKCKSRFADRLLTTPRHLVDIKCSQVSYLFAPQYTGLGIKQILAQT